MLLDFIYFSYCLFIMKVKLVFNLVGVIIYFELLVFFFGCEIEVFFLVFYFCFVWYVKIDDMIDM